METLLVTGGIGSGKSAVTALLSAKGFPVFDCDAAAKTRYDRDPALVEALEQDLGQSLRGADGRLDRRRLAARIFSDAAALAAVEARVHPAVLAEFRAWRALQHAPAVVMESAIALSKPLFDGEYDRVLLVEAPEEVRIARIMARDGVSREAALARMSVQAFDLSKVDFILGNDGSLADLSRRLDRLSGYLFSE